MSEFDWLKSLDSETLVDLHSRYKFGGAFAKTPRLKKVFVSLFIGGGLFSGLALLEVVFQQLHWFYGVSVFWAGAAAWALRLVFEHETFHSQLRDAIDTEIQRRDN